MTVRRERMGTFILWAARRVLVFVKISSLVSLKVWL